jgi:plasmid stabilization system protein ParE
MDHVGILGSFPYIGPWYPRASRGAVHEILYKKYRIFYAVLESAKRVEILRIRHTAQDEIDIEG